MTECSIRNVDYGLIKSETCVQGFGVQGLGGSEGLRGHNRFFFLERGKRAKNFGKVTPITSSVTFIGV